jgi:hypothetical protein
MIKVKLLLITIGLIDCNNFFGADNQSSQEEKNLIVEILKENEKKLLKEDVKEYDAQEKDIITTLGLPYQIDLTFSRTDYLMELIEEIEEIFKDRSEKIQTERSERSEILDLNIDEIQKKKDEFLDCITKSFPTITQSFKKLQKDIRLDTFGEKNQSNFNSFLMLIGKDIDVLRKSNDDFSRSFFILRTRFYEFKTTVVISFLNERLQGNIFVAESLKQELNDLIKNEKKNHFEKISEIFKLEESERQKNLDEYIAVIKNHRAQAFELCKKYFEDLKGFHSKVKANPEPYIKQYNQQVVIPSLMKNPWFLVSLVGNGVSVTGLLFFFLRKPKSLANNGSVQNFSMATQEPRS